MLESFSYCSLISYCCVICAISDKKKKLEILYQNALVREREYKQLVQLLLEKEYYLPSMITKTNFLLISSDSKGRALSVRSKPSFARSIFINRLLFNL